MQSSWARPRGRRASRRETGWGHQCKMVTQRIGDEKKPLKEGFRKFGECHVRLSVADINRGDFFAARSPARKSSRFREFGVSELRVGEYVWQSSSFTTNQGEDVMSLANSQARVRLQCPRTLCSSQSLNLDLRYYPNSQPAQPV